jgi:hypothetical protein
MYPLWMSELGLHTTVSRSGLASGVGRRYFQRIKAQRDDKA